MNKEEIKNRIDFNNIQQLNYEKRKGVYENRDYLVDFDGNYIIPLSPLNMKLIEKILDLEKRIIELEEKIISLEEVK